MSDTTSDRPPIWDRSFTNDLSTAWQNLKDLGNQLVPSDHPWYQKLEDIGSAPAKLAWSGIKGFADTMGSAMRDPNLLNDPAMQHAVTGQMLSLAPLSAGLPEAEGIPSFPAWHGSPHRFEPESERPFGRFMEEKMGTGEGAQVRGWGHYIAGERETAETYRTAGDDPVGTVHLDGDPIDTDLLWSDPEFTDTERHAITSYETTHLGGGNPQDAINSLKAHAQHLRSMATGPAQGYENMINAMRSWNDPLTGEALTKTAEEWRQEDVKTAGTLDGSADWLENNQHRLTYTPGVGGHLYQVWIKPEAHELLDQDRLWDQQPQGVKDKISKSFPDLAEEASAFSLDGRDVYDKLAQHFEKARSNVRADQAASEGLDAAGIPGMKFLDQGSRSLPKEIHLEHEPWQPKSREEELAKYMTGEGPTSLHVMHHPDQLQDNLNWAWNALSDDLDTGTYSNSRHLLGPDTAEAHHEITRGALDWINHNQERLTLGDSPEATHNYVMFHHRHINVIDRNGQVYGLSSVDHDPFEK